MTNQTQDQLSESEFLGSSIELTSNTIDILKSTAKWTKFISIMGFIACGLLVIASFYIMFFFRVPMAIFPSTALGVVYLFMAFVYAIPVYYLFKFSSMCAMAVESKNNTQMQHTMEYLRNHFRSIGIIIIVITAIYAVIFLIGIAAGGLAALSL